MILTANPHNLVFYNNEIYFNMVDHLYNIKTHVKLDFTHIIDLDELNIYKNQNEIVLDIHQYNYRECVLTTNGNSYKIYKHGGVIFEVQGCKDYCFFDTCFYYAIDNSIHRYDIINNEHYEVSTHKNLQAIGYNEDLVYCSNNKVHYKQKSYQPHNKKISMLYVTSTNIYSACSEKIVSYSPLTDEITVICKHNDELVDLKANTTQIYILLKTNLILYEKMTQKISVILLLNTNVRFQGNINDFKYLRDETEKDLFGLKNEDTKLCITADVYQEGNYNNLMLFTDDYSLYMVKDVQLVRQFKFSIKYENCFMHNNDCFMVIKGKNARNSNKLLHYKIDIDRLIYHNIININIDNVERVLYIDEYYIFSNKCLTVLTNAGMISMRYKNVIDFGCFQGLVVAYKNKLQTQNDNIEFDSNILQISTFDDDLFVLSEKGLYSHNNKDYIIYIESEMFTITDAFIIFGCQDKIVYYNYKYEMIKELVINYRLSKIANENLCIDENGEYRTLSIN